MKVELWTHPDFFPGASIDAVAVRLSRPAHHRLHFRYEVSGRIAELYIAEPAEPVRADRLWETTCFEAFLKPVGQTGYLEFNFSPSSRWAAYAFDAYRAGMTQAALPAVPAIMVQRSNSLLVVDVDLALDLEPVDYRIGVSAVIDERDAPISYWALGHPGDHPDFHHDTCFGLELPAAT